MMYRHHRPYGQGILIVDDTLDNLRFLSKTLTKQGYKVRGVISGRMALTAAQTLPPDLILLDIKMPDLSGYEVCKQLKANDQTRDIPVIFLSALNETIDKVRAFAVGGMDYITKPFNLEEVVARVKNQLDIKAAQEEVKQLNAELEFRVKARTQQLEVANQKLLHMALHDSLVGLPNRLFLRRKLEDALDKAKEKADYCFAILFLDCDDFGRINDSLGHLLGDQLLIAIAHRLRSAVNSQDTLARFGGDEFTILLENIEDLHRAIAVAQKIQEVCLNPFQIEGRDIFINFSIGIVLGTRAYQRPEDLLRDADTAMYQAKINGKGCHQVFDADMHTNVYKRLQLEMDLRRVLERQELVLCYQPIVDLQTKQTIALEALLRWHHPQRGAVKPDDFIPIAEETGLIIPIGRWVLMEACRQLKLWQETLLAQHLKMSVNLSVKQFAQQDLVEEIDHILADVGLAGNNLKLEITESVIIDNAELANSIFRQLQERHIELSLDDFGTGFSSLSYLHRFPVDNLKIDRSFVSRLDTAKANLELVRGIISLAHCLGIQAIAEGIETVEQVHQLQDFGCEFGQGFFFSEPLRREDVEAFLLNNPRW